MTYEDIEGWFDWPDLYMNVVSKYQGGILVEVGCFLGKSLCYLGHHVKESKKPFQVVGVDWCVGSGVEVYPSGECKDNHQKAVQEGSGSFAGVLHRNVVGCGLGGVVSILVASSEMASRLFADKSLTMVLLDARHDYESVKKDIELWLPKVKDSGIICGDDYCPVWPGVVKAVDEAFGSKVQLVPHDAWMVEV